jgi:uncharacterized UPF0160 family protein
MSRTLQRIPFSDGRVFHFLGASVVSSIISNDFPRIGTHDGSFHCDEALATALLKMHPLYEESIIVRSRNPDILKQCDVVVDVGAVYDPETNRYDHHQREFSGTLEGYNTKLSSAGLVFKHFGKGIISSILQKQNYPVSDTFVDVIFKKLYEDFIEHIDAIDNGISINDSVPKYYVSTTLSNRVGQLNPRWNEIQNTDAFNNKFKIAMEITGLEFLTFLEDSVLSWWPARSIVLDSFSTTHSIHPTKKIMILEQSCPWKDHLFELEIEVSYCIHMIIIYPT